MSSEACSIPSCSQPATAIACAFIAAVVYISCKLYICAYHLLISPFFWVEFHFSSFVCPLSSAPSLSRSVPPSLFPIFSFLRLLFVLPPSALLFSPFSPLPHFTPVYHYRHFSLSRPYPFSHPLVTSRLSLSFSCCKRTTYEPRRALQLSSTI